ncbi:MAG: HRDC domain-containing protein [Candidatus Latescibacterota bacterium]|nr:HRDC domain-containing protein [Candidatus Latescibacterota bacterium]
MIETPHELEALLEEARVAGIAAVDTELVWERTFYPALGVVQVGLSRERCLLVDAVALPDLLGFGFLSDSDVTKILHDAVQDLTILKHVTGAVPKCIFDTRVAAGFVGLASTISLRDLVRELIGVELAKTETRTDWLRRPLTETQIGYAEDDVRYLPEIVEILRCRAAERGLDAWLVEEMTALDEPSIYEQRDPRKEYRRVKGHGRLSRQDLAVLRELTAWRELVARSQDRPRGRVASDKLLLHLAQSHPATTEDLANVRSLRSRDVAVFGGDLVRSVQCALELSEEEWPQGPPKSHYDRRFEARAKEAQQLVSERSEEAGIDAALVATRAEVRGLMRQSEGEDILGNRLARGWRHQLVGADLAERFAEPG